MGPEKGLKRINTQLVRSHLKHCYVYRDMMLDAPTQRAGCLSKPCSGCGRCVLNPTPTTPHTPLLAEPTKHSRKLKNFAQHLNSEGLAKKAER